MSDVNETITNASLDVEKITFSDRSLPKVSRFLLGGFHWYSRRLLRKNFNAVRVARGSQPAIASDQSLVCFVNHPGWWDPLLAFLTNQLCFPGRVVFTPIDQQSLAQYPVFRQLGFYGIEMDSIEGARQFLGVTRQLLLNPTTAIWVTPGGAFSDVRRRTKFQPGLAHIAASKQKATLLPVAFEYVFWEERTPEALIEFGEPIEIQRQRQSKSQWQNFLEERLAQTQASLAEKAVARDYKTFDLLLSGSAGVGGGYDLVRRTKAILRRQSFDPRHCRGEGVPS
ncbi:MAG: lysophospholipid acyltransferase family protein [Pirellulaceae bacterium]|nr:lysophospholipid acyltransferase family protein [Pirellulaceae bacterium]